MDVIYNVDDVAVAIDCYMEFLDLVRAQKDNIERKLDAFKSAKPVDLTTDESSKPAVTMGMRPPKTPSDHMPKAKPGAPAPLMAAMRPPKTS